MATSRARTHSDPAAMDTEASLHQDHVSENPNSFRDEKDTPETNGASQEGVVAKDYAHDPEAAVKSDNIHGCHHNHHQQRAKLSFAQRSIRITWAWFPASLSTGGIASLISKQPYTFDGLLVIGKIFYILSLVIFCVFFSLIAARFIRKPRALSTSLHHPSESFFFGGFWVAVALIINGIQTYGVPASGPWLVRAMKVLFWLYYGCAYVVAVLQYHVIFQVERLAPQDAMPMWIFPAYPFLVTGTLASAVAETQNQETAVPIILAGLAGQGQGWILAFFVYTVYLTRLIHGEMPEPSARPGMFMSVGPAAYTCAGLLALGKAAKANMPPDLLGDLPIPVGDIWYAVSVPAALFLWLIAIWFSALSAVSVANGASRMNFSLQWWSMVFPNVGLAMATIGVGEAVESRPIRIAGSVLTCLVIPMWFVCAVGHIRAIWRRDLMAPGKDIGVDDVNHKHDIKQARHNERKKQKQELKRQQHANGGHRTNTFPLSRADRRATF